MTTMITVTIRITVMMIIIIIIIFVIFSNEARKNSPSYRHVSNSAVFVFRVESWTGEIYFK